MATRQAACEPCRRAKIGCDHKRPVCTRCALIDKASLCSYRASPFRRRQSRAHSVLVEQLSPSCGRSPAEPLPPSSTTSSGGISYPNPGHLGSSSHVAIFSHIHPQRHTEVTVDLASGPALLTVQRPFGTVDLNAFADKAGDLLNELLISFDLTAMENLVDFWFARGTRLALAEPFVQQCAGSMEYVRTHLTTHGIHWYSHMTSYLLRNSALPLEYSATSTISEFTDQFCGHNVRWETFGLFLSAVVRATFDVPFFPRLYMTELEKQKFRGLVMKLNRCSLELCLSLDSLNDLQLVFQYENFIVSSYVDGDHNLSSWRSLGDVIASLFALGYHEDIRTKPNVPTFLIKLRTTAFARVYSADKNIAIFLGRPPRMSKRFCVFQLPSGDMGAETAIPKSQDQLHIHSWKSDSAMNYTSESCWSALCASIKEEVLELLHSARRSNHAETVSELCHRAESYWQALPSHFRLHDKLKQHSTQTPFERDFLASVRLNHLHVQFLLRLAILNRLVEPDAATIELAQQLLSLTVETILLREHLVNSGTGLIWKIAHYALPAAGIVLLAILNRRERSSTRKSLCGRVCQDLSVLVAEIQMGSIIRPHEPNYDLLFRASQTIQDFLQSLDFNVVPSDEEVSSSLYNVGALDEWSGRSNLDPWNLEIEFWQNLAEHPSIAGMDTTV